MAQFVIRFGPNASSDIVRKRARCTVCGHKGASLRYPSWVSRTVGVQPFPMVITEPNKFVSEVHDRMPVILEAKDFEQWESGDVKDAAALMRPAGEDVLQRWPVAKTVNSSRADDGDATLIDDIAL